MNYTLPIVACCAGALIYCTTKGGATFKEKSIEEQMQQIFGEPMTVEKFTLQEASGWINQRVKNLENGCKATIFKASKKTLQSFGFSIKGDAQINNYLVIAIIDPNNSNKNEQIKEKVLIKYKHLDEKLEKTLANGDGMVVIDA